jgi:glycosyltransferase (activator-dependent family)
MRVLFAVFPATAHVHPVVPLAWALQNAGHEVRIAIHPEAAHLVEEAGLTPVPVGAGTRMREVVAFNSDVEKLDILDDKLSLDVTRQRPDLDQQWYDLTHNLYLYGSVLDSLIAFTGKWRPDLVIWDPFCIAASVAARLCGAAQARFLWGQDNIAWLREKSLRSLAERRAAPGDDPVVNLMKPLLTPHGLSYEEEFLLGQWTIDPTPEDLRLPADLHYESIRHVPYNGTKQLPDWSLTKPGRPRVALTLGIGGRGRQLFRQSGAELSRVLESVAGLDVELVATLGPRQIAEVSGSVPDNVRLLEYAPLNHLLPTCSAVIHHGGAGTYAAAVAHRVPQLIVPMPFWAEETTARHVAARSAGLVLDSGDFTAETLRAQLSRLLDDPRFQKGADALHREMRTVPGPAELVPVLEELTTRYAPGAAPTGDGGVPASAVGAAAS